MKKSDANSYDRDIATSRHKNEYELRREYTVVTDVWKSSHDNVRQPYRCYYHNIIMFYTCEKPGRRDGGTLKVVHLNESSDDLCR